MRLRFTTTTKFRSAIHVMAAFLVLVAQIGVASAGVLDGREGASAASHLESGGTNLHFAHNEADCFMCRAQHLGDAAPTHAQVVGESPAALPLIVLPEVAAVTIAQRDTNTSRAPPATV